MPLAALVEAGSSQGGGSGQQEPSQGLGLAAVALPLCQGQEII